MPGSAAESGATTAASVLSTRPDAASPVMAAGTFALWRSVDLDVSAVIGQRGTAAVLRQALATVRRTHGWLPDPADDCGFDACMRCLDDAPDGRGIEEVAAGRLAVQVAFGGLLASLVGVELAGQLLGAAWPGRQVLGEPMP